VDDQQSLTHEVGAWFDVPVEHLPPAVARAEKVVLKAGEKVLKVDADRFAEVYEKTYRSFDARVMGRLHPDALLHMAAAAADLGDTDLREKLKTFAQAAVGSVGVTCGDGSVWVPGARPVRKRVVVTAAEREETKAEVQAFFSKEGEK
jgi:hypothetical protein